MRRLRWLVLLVALGLVVGAAPVLGEEPPVGDPVEGLAPGVEPFELGPGEVDPGPSPGPRDLSVSVSEVDPADEVEVLPAPVFPSDPDAGKSGLVSGTAGVSFSRFGGTETVGVLPVRVGVDPDRAVVPTDVSVTVLDPGDAEMVSSIGFAVKVDATRGRSDGVSDHLSATSVELWMELDYSEVPTGGLFVEERLQMFRWTGCFELISDAVVCSDREAVETINDPQGKSLWFRVQDSLLPGTDAEPLPAIAVPVPFFAAPLLLASRLSYEASLYSASGSGTGPSGDFSASPLAVLADYQVGLFTGSFQTSYPFELVPAAAGAMPSVGLSYDSGSVDGLHHNINTQGGQVGLGWSLGAGGSITRQFTGCSYTEAEGDLCADGDEYVLSLNGVGSKLIRITGDPDGTYSDNSGAFRLEADPYWKIELKTSGATNGDVDDEWWLVTTPDGTEYSFGKEATTGQDSAWWTPIYSPSTTSWDWCPANLEGYPGGTCPKVWQWNLDLVEDTNGNQIRYFYETETNHFQARTGTSAGNRMEYVRAGYLDHIDYTIHTSHTQANARVEFEYGDRCTAATPANCVDHTASDWPDVPWDLACDGSVACDESPTFWTALKLEAVETSYWNPEGSGAWVGRDRWELSHSYYPPDDDSYGDESLPKLYLDWIKRKNLETSTYQNATRYVEAGEEPVWLDNRTYRASGYSPMTMPRIGYIRNPLGGEVEVTYGMSHDCVEFTSTTDDDYPEGDVSGSYADRCDYYYTQWYNAAVGVPDKFNKWKVLEVTRNATGGNPAVTTEYLYPEPPRWHYAEIAPCWGFWSDFRGHESVVVHDTNSGTYTEHRFFQGMDGDEGCTLGPWSYDVETSDEVSYDDDDWLKGRTLEVRVLDDDPYPESGTAGSNLAQTITTYYMTETESEDTRFIAPDTVTSTEFGATTDRETKVEFEYDIYGNVTFEKQHGDTAASGDERMTQILYTVNTTAWIVNTPKSIRLREGILESPLGTELSRTLIYYDGATSTGTAPVKGNVTEVRGYYQNTPTDRHVATTSSYDSMGRATLVFQTRDGNARASWASTDPRTRYSYDSTSGLVTEIEQMSAGVTALSTRYAYEPGRASPTEIVGPNAPETYTVSTDEVTTAAYDGWGRVTDVWYPGRARTSTANVHYVYTINLTSPSRIRTKTAMNGGAGTVSTFAYLDGFARQIQTQTGFPATGSASSVVSTTYDASGRVARTTAPYELAVAAGAAYQSITWSTVDQYTKATYDHLGRVTDQSVYKGSNQTTALWSTETSYEVGEYTVTDPNGNDTVYYTDGLGRMTQVTDALSGDTTYDYDLSDNLLEVDPPGTTQTIEITYDLLGRKTLMDDPDSGIWTYGHDARSNLTAQGSFCEDDAGTVTCDTTLTTTYDGHNRPTETKEGTTVLAEWEYDDATNGIGFLSESSTNGSATEAVVTVDSYDVAGRVTAKTWTIDGTDHPVGWSYYTGGQLKSITYPDGTTETAGEKVTYLYDAAARPYSLTGDDTYTLDDYVINAEYNAQGQPLYRWQNKAWSETEWDTWIQRAWNYKTDGSLRLRTLSAGSAKINSWDQTNIQRLRFDAYDPGGNITRIRDYRNSSQYQCFEYDDLNRLTRGYTSDDACVTVDTGIGNGGYTRHYDYSASGNITQLGSITDYTYGTRNEYGSGDAGPHAVTLADGIDFTYDDVGSMLRADLDDAYTDYTYNDWNRLTAVDFPTGDDLAMIYDADGARVTRTEGSSTITYIGDLYEIIDDGTTTTTRTHYTFAGDHIAVREDTGATDTITYLFTDHLGSVAATYLAGTTTRYQHRYYPYGQPRGTATGFPSDHTYTGQINDPGDLMYYRARYYQPGIGRFTQPDTIIPDPGSGQDYNRYMYVGGNPTMFSDPSGRCHRVENGVCIMYVEGATWYFHDGGAVVVMPRTDEMPETVTGKAYISSSCGPHTCSFLMSTSLSGVPENEIATAAADHTSRTGERHFKLFSNGETMETTLTYVDWETGMEVEEGQGVRLLTVQSDRDAVRSHLDESKLDPRGGGPTYVMVHTGPEDDLSGATFFQVETGMAGIHAVTTMDNVYGFAACGATFKVNAGLSGACAVGLAGWIGLRSVMGSHTSVEDIDPPIWAAN